MCQKKQPDFFWMFYFFKLPKPKVDCVTVVNDALIIMSLVVNFPDRNTKDIGGVTTLASRILTAVLVILTFVKLILSHLLGYY